MATEKIGKSLLSSPEDSSEIKTNCNMTLWNHNTYAHADWAMSYTTHNEVK